MSDSFLNERHVYITSEWYTTHKTDKLGVGRILGISELEMKQQDSSTQVLSKILRITELEIKKQDDQSNHKILETSIQLFMLTYKLSSQKPAFSFSHSLTSSGILFRQKNLYCNHHILFFFASIHHIKLNARRTGCFQNYITTLRHLRVN